MIVIVGHGPSANTVDGSWLDSNLVLRLKDPYGRNDSYMSNRGVAPGTRTDVVMSRHLMFRRGYEDMPYWLFPRKGKVPHKVPGNVWMADIDRWYSYWEARTNGLKPSTGLCAIFCAVEQGYDDIGLVGFDSFFYGCQVAPHIGEVELGVAQSLATITNCSPAELEYGRIGALNGG